jgi:hypothetical protein
VTTAATAMLVVTFPMRAAAIVVVAPASIVPASSPDPPLELPEELPDPLDPLELPEPLEPPELPEGEPESGGGDDELLPHANRTEDAIDATASKPKARG